MAEWNDDDDADGAAIDKVSRRSDKLDTHLMKGALHCRQGAKAGFWNV